MRQFIDVRMETAQHLDRLPKNQPAEITLFQISEVQESPAFNGRRSFLTLRGHRCFPSNTVLGMQAISFAGKETLAGSC